MSRQDMLRRLVDQTVATVRRQGWRAVMVGAGVDDLDTGAPFTYSVGFALMGHPDIVVTGLRPDVAANFIGRAHERIAAGQRYEPLRLYDDLAEGYLSRFEPLHDFWYGRLLRMAPLVYGLLGETHPAGALQLFYPDRYGRWPWMDETALEFRILQPRLDLPPRPPRFPTDTTLRAVIGAPIAMA